jgi:hypothetical protein
MKTRTVFLIAAFCLSVVAAGFASDPNLGTWKLNEAKSKVPAGAPKNNLVVYAAAGDSFKCVVDGVDGNGKPTHNEWTGKFDGKDYPVTGDPNADTRAIQKVDDHHYNLNNKKGGKAVITGTIVVEGKTRTVTLHRTNPSGEGVTSTFVFDKQ